MDANIGSSLFISLRMWEKKRGELLKEKKTTRTFVYLTLDNPQSCEISLKDPRNNLLHIVLCLN